MAFWGVEVKPGKPFTLTPSVGRRLHVSQATLGTGTSKKKSVVQCNVGDRSPVSLCSLFPEKVESLQLHLEFEETVEVVFSVVGPQSVHLTGYYLGGGRHYDPDDGTESFGEDIADTETERSANGSDEDDYEDSFINDDDPEVIPPSPVSSVGVEKMLDKLKPEKGKGSDRRLRKKYQMSESGDDGVSRQKNFANSTTAVTLLDSENEGMLPISLLCKSGSTAKSMKAQAKEEKVKKSEEQSKEEELHEAEGEDDFFFGKVFKWDKAQQRETEADKLSQNLIMINEDDQKTANDNGDDDQHLPLPSTDMVLGNVAKAKKRSKKQAKKEKCQQDEATVENIGQDIPVAIKENQRRANDEEDKGPQDEDNADNVEHDLPLTNKENWRQENDGDDKGLQDEANAENVGYDMPLTNKENHRDDKVLKDEASNGNEGQVVPMTGEEIVKQADDKGVDLPCMWLGTENVAKPRRKKKERANRKPLETDSGSDGNVIKDDKGTQDEFKSGSMDLDLCVQNEQNEKQHNYVNVEQSAGENHSEKKRKKKKRRTQESREASNIDDKSSQHRTLSNGLVIEELETGKPDGKISAPGKKISIHYTGKLKENGQVFDSNVDGAPFKFRLGEGRALECWDVGLDGMRVGEKRRLVVPPSLGFGSDGHGKEIPPNSWLVYDIELLKVK